MKKDGKIDFKYDLKIYFGLLSRYKILFLGVLAFVLLMEASGVLDKFLFKVIIDKGTEFVNGSLAKQRFIQIILIVVGIFIGNLFIRVISKWLNIHLLNRLDANLILDLKRKFFNHLIYLSHSFHVSHKTGSLISRLSRGGRAIERMTDTLVFNFATMLFQTIVVGVSLAFFDITSTIIIIITIFVFVVYSFINQHYQQRANLVANEAEDIEKANIGDIFTNIDSIKYFGKEKFIKKRFEGLTNITRRTSVFHWNYFRWLESGQSLILGIGTFFLMYFPIVKFLDGELTVGTLVFISTVYLSLMGPLFWFVHGLRELYRVMADFESLFQYSRIEREVKDLPNVGQMKIKNGDIEFKDISFNYGKRRIFNNLNLKIKKNEKIALVGHSGCGKTTLVKLLYRFYDVDSGEILVDNQDIRGFKQESLREEMSVVPQEGFLFDDTVYNNISFSKPNASRSEVMGAIRFAQLDKIIKEFPNNEEAIVGERGVKLSGGEKQRVSIARAILADKKILVLDEATSSLDSETEHEIQKDLQKLMKGRTAIIIAHRLSTIMKADRIIVMKKGRIVQIGKHKDLINKKGEYRKLWALQRGGYIR
ncbi:ABC transporter ATP-binding protein [Candidatus Woesearchaeota archaeon]|nr:ABC transporter ATP-binding protein [Candidatus Woesearchaeota archaeon]